MRRAKPTNRAPADPAIAAETPSSSCSPPATDPKEAAATAIEQAAAAGNLKACKMVAEGVPQQLRGIDTNGDPNAGLSRLQREALFEAERAKPETRELYQIQTGECPFCRTALDLRIGPGLTIRVVSEHPWPQEAYRGFRKP